MKVRYRETMWGGGRSLLLVRELGRTNDLGAGCCQSEEDSQVAILRKRVPGERHRSRTGPEAGVRGPVGHWREQGMRMSM